MIKITVKVGGLQCGMCEAHINDAVRNAFPVKRVTSSRGRKETVILTEGDIEDPKLASCINGAGYTFYSATREPYEKKGMLAFLRRS